MAAASSALGRLAPHALPHPTNRLPCGQRAVDDARLRDLDAAAFARERQRSV
ncbi:hypothetical protein [Myxococcus landrumensis]|uniref:Uncharacterized protein n=1 Tax=Myxococcus landrumensis TaxID=2813577 RepID=A0ABX7NEG4_9BACT|nr:hypothetical protein [Myxococcus landrumus]QSQ17205.1 hypothetical protein JY572_14585 [Myxococcus landrumus]